ncbi:MAG: hypothetical protein ABIR33_02800 [Pyrinomonadaceae bacterium]
MFKKTLVLGLCVAILNLCFSTSAVAGTKEEKDVKFAAKVRSNIQKLGQGKEARVQVKLKDGTKLKGYVSQINEDSFLVMNDATGTATDVPYSQTKQVKGNNLSNGAWIAIGVGILAAVIAIIILAGNSD